ncbi:MAG TPA: hypothetical protein VFG38_10290 [Pseudomonadales bacterium]|nr:hypothetical protein [Pseudomonadales bacterium]
MRTDADDLDIAVGRELADDGGHFARADIETHYAPPSPVRRHLLNHLDRVRSHCHLKFRRVVAAPTDGDAVPVPGVDVLDPIELVFDHRAIHERKSLYAFEQIFVPERHRGTVGESDLPLAECVLVYFGDLQLRVRKHLAQHLEDLHRARPIRIRTANQRQRRVRHPGCIDDVADTVQHEAVTPSRHDRIFRHRDFDDARPNPPRSNVARPAERQNVANDFVEVQGQQPAFEMLRHGILDGIAFGGRQVTGNANDLNGPVDREQQSTQSRTDAYEQSDSEDATTCRHAVANFHCRPANASRLD